MEEIDAEARQEFLDGTITERSFKYFADTKDQYETYKEYFESYAAGIGENVARLRFHATHPKEHWWSPGYRESVAIENGKVNVEWSRWSVDFPESYLWSEGYMEAERIRLEQEAQARQERELVDKKTKEAQALENRRQLYEQLKKEFA